MPKEVVYGDQAFVPSEGELSRTPIAEVRWSREAGHVQVVTRVQQAEVMVEPAERPLYEYGFYVDLDRSAINGLIRNLRRARDQAFGRDE